MDLEDKFSLDHLIFQERVCRVCGETKSLMDDFYLTRKDRGTVAAAYSYECKQCCIYRVSNARKSESVRWEYPDWQFTSCFPSQNIRNNKYFQIHMDTPRIYTWQA